MNTNDWYVKPEWIQRESDRLAMRALPVRHKRSLLGPAMALAVLAYGHAHATPALITVQGHTTITYSCELYGLTVRPGQVNQRPFLQATCTSETVQLGRPLTGNRVTSPWDAQLYMSEHNLFLTKCAAPLIAWSETVARVQLICPGA